MGAIVMEVMERALHIRPRRSVGPSARPRRQVDPEVGASERCSSIPAGKGRWEIQVQVGNIVPCHLSIAPSL